MRAIFVSYRREDTEGQAGRLFDDLVRHFGEDSVCMSWWRAYKRSVIADTGK
jgi:hypothetical protein